MNKQCIRIYISEDKSCKIKPYGWSVISFCLELTEGQMHILHIKKIFK